MPNGLPKRKKPNKIEDQAITVFHFWFADGGMYSERVSLYLNGLFEMLKKKYPEECDEALQDAKARIERERSQWPFGNSS